jgi:hypothetical protein
VPNDLSVGGGLTLSGATSGSSTFTAPATGSVLSYVLPGTAGAADSVLTNDGSGNLTWALPGGGGSTFGNITVGVVTDNTISTTTGDLDITATGNNGVNITSGSDAPTLITRNVAVTNTAVRGLSLSAETSLTPAVGFGNTLEYQVEAQPGNVERAGYISVNLTDITAASEDFSMYFGLMQNGATYSSKMILDSAGNLVTDGGLTVNNTITTGTGNLALSAAGTNYVTIDSGTTGPTIITRLGGNTNLNTRSLILNSQSTGTPAVGIGNSVEFQVETAVGVTTAGGYLSVTSTDITPGAEKFKMGFGLMDSGAAYTEVAALSSVGDLQLDGNLTATGATLGAVTVGVDTDNTISTSSGNLTLQTAAGVNAGTMVLTAGANGAITLAPNGTGNVATTFNNGGNLTNNRNYVFGAIRNATTQSIGDIWSLNSTTTAQPFRGVSLDNSADTTKNAGTVLRNYSNTAANRSRLIFERARTSSTSPLVPAALQAGDFLGSVDATGYTSTGWLNDGVAAVTPAFFGFAAAENWVSNTNLGTNFTLSLAPTATTITSSANSVNVLSITPQASTYRADTHSFTAGKSGSYSFLDMNGNRVLYNVPIKFPAFLATAVNNTLATTAASGTGSVATLTFGALASAPFTVGSQVIVAGVTPAGYNGTQTVTACSTTSVSYTSTATGAQTVAGTIKVAGSVGWQIAVSDSPTVGGRMAFWDTTNSRFSYISDNSAV